MNAERHTSSSEIIDRVAQIDNSDLSSKVHPSRLYPLNKSALITEVPSRGDIGLNLVWLTQMHTILRAIDAASRISYRADLLLPKYLYEHNVELADSSSKFYKDLRNFNQDAEYYWCLLRVWFQHNKHEYGWSDNLLSFESPDEYNEEWGYHSERFVYEIDNLDDFELENYGIVVDSYIDSDGELIVSGATVEDFDKFDSHYQLQEYELDPVIDWFKGHLDEINYLYQHSVKLINQTAYDLIEKDKLSRSNYQVQQDAASLKWPLNPKGDGHVYFSRGFRSAYFGENFDCFDRVPSCLIQMILKNSEDMVKSLVEHIYYFEHLERTGSTAILTASQVKKWQDWYEQRKRWHTLYKGVKLWWWSHEENELKDRLTEGGYRQMVDLQKKVKIKMDDLELLKADQAVLSKVGPKKKPIDQADTIKKLLEAVEEYKPFLDKYGLVFRIEKKHDFDSPDPTALRFLEEIWTKPNRRKLALKRDKSEEPGQLANASKLEAKLRDYIGSKEYDAWYNVLNDGEGRCSRHSIGYQKVTKPGAKDSAYRNAGMRFVEANHLEPVANFDEVNLEKALTDQVKQQCKLKDIPDAWVNNIIRGFRWCRGDEELRDEFSLRLKDVGYEASDIDTFIKLAQSQVGKKITTKKTLYDARQVAGVLAYEQDKNPKLQPKELPKPKAPGKPKVVVL